MVAINVEADIVRITVLCQPMQKVDEIPTEQKTLGVMVGICHPSYCRNINRRVEV
jgi:hypothetical protein